MAEQQILLVGDRVKRETHKAIIACNDYLRMGPGRSLAKLHKTYTETELNLYQKPPTKHLSTIKGWSTDYGWVERAAQYDAMIEEEKNAKRKEIMENGLALDYERVNRLITLFGTIEGELLDKNNKLIQDALWLPDVKSIGSGEHAERVNIVRYNTKIVDDLRGVLDDIAKETGGRNKKQDQEDPIPKDSPPLSIPADLIAPSFINVYRDIRQKRHTEYVLKGGRGSTKSSFVSLVFIELLINNPEIHGLVTRQVKDTLRDSVYSQLEWAINMLGLDDKFKCTKSPLEMEYLPTGQKIYFRGADDPNKIKSIRPAFGYIGIEWNEELDQYHGEEAIRKIDQSVIRGGEIAYIFRTFNPPKTKNNWANKYVAVPKDSMYVHHSTYLDVPEEWLGTPWLAEAEHLKKVSPTAYDHEYLGIANGLGGMVFDNVITRAITDEEIATFDRERQGLDWGFYPDPAHWGRTYYHAASRTLYIYDEMRKWRTGNRELYDALVSEKGIKSTDMLIADSAEPKSISDFVAYGMRGIRAAEKGPDSVRYGMKWLQSLNEIVIDNERCPFTNQEFTEYEYERTKDGEIIEAYPDKNNHSIDMTRYAQNDEWRRGGH